MHEEAAQHDAFWALPPLSASRIGPSDGAAGAPGPLPVNPAQLGFTGLARPGSADASAGDLIIRQLQRFAEANESLRHELSRCHDRLNVVLEISENFSSIEDPEAIEAALLSRYASTLDAAALLISHGGGCVRLPLGTVDGASVAIPPDRLCERLATEMDVVRRTRRACRLNLPEARQRGLDQVHVLLSALQKNADAPHVVIALRGGTQPHFDSNDRLASETVLTYGGHILRNALMVQRLQQLSLETVGALANAIEARDKYTGGHSERVGWLAVLTGKVLGLPPSDLQMLEWAGLLHDVGKIGIPEHILNKPGELTAEEFEQIKQHPRLGYDVLRPVSSLQPMLEAVLYHHENHDGSGYPEGLRREQIPLLARILHVVDILDALISTRSYRGGLAVEDALQVLSEGGGRVTDPMVTGAFVSAFREHMRTQAGEFRQRFAHF